MSSERTKRETQGTGSDPAARQPSALAILLMRRPDLTPHVVEDDRAPATDRRAPVRRARPDNNVTKNGEVKEVEAENGG